jgi:hypothetical protein
MSLVDKILISAVWVASAVRFSNTSGTVLTSATDATNGRAIADEYTLTLSAVSSGTGTVTVGTTSPNNPYKGRVVTGVSLNGTTIYKNIIPGVSLVFSASGANTNVGSVLVGQYLGTFDAFGGGAGVPSASTRHQVINTGSGAVSAAVASLKTQAICVDRTGTVFNYVKPFAIGSTEKTAGGGSARVMPYAISVANTTGSGSSKVTDLLVDGVTLGAGSLLDVSAGTTVSGSGIKAITPSYVYIVQTGPLTGMEFAIDPSVANGNTANILVFPSRYVQIAPDVSGDPGTWGTADVDLTQSGQGTGVIQPAGDAYYHTRILVPAGASSESNPYPANVALVATETGAAGWTA